MRQGGRSLAGVVAVGVVLVCLVAVNTACHALDHSGPYASHRSLRNKWCREDGATLGAGRGRAGGPLGGAAAAAGPRRHACAGPATHAACFSNRFGSPHMLVLDLEVALGHDGPGLAGQQGSQSCAFSARLAVEMQSRGKGR